MGYVSFREGILISFNTFTKYSVAEFVEYPNQYFSKLFSYVSRILSEIVSPFQGMWRISGKKLIGFSRQFRLFS